MRWLRSLPALLALCILPACDARQDPGKPALWEIRGPGGSSEGWLFGTIHALPDGTRWRTPMLDSRLAQADLLVVEVAALDDEKAVTAAFDALAFDRHEGPLETRVAHGLSGKLAALRREAGLQAGGLDAMESWAAALALARLAQTGDAANGVDRALIADFADRRVVELEGAPVQLALFDALPPCEQRDLLAAVIAESDIARSRSVALAESWRHGDLAAIEREAGRGILADAELREALLLGRNRAWADRIVAMLASGKRPFVAVGTAHLVGADSLPALLQRAGYTVRRIQ